MKQDPFYTFLEFVSADAACYQVEQQIQTIQNKHAQAQAQLAQQEAALARAQEQLQVIERACSARELDIQVLRERLAAVRRARDNAHTVKEFQASSQEETRLIDTIDKAEDALFACDEARQNALKTKTQVLQEYQQIEQAYAESMSCLRPQEVQLGQEYERLLAKRTHVAALVDPAFMHDFMIRKKRVHNPAVAVVNQACSACYHGVTTHEYMRLKRHVIGVCSQCYRMLFIP